MSWRARVIMALRLMVCIVVMGSRPMKRFSATERFGQRLTS